MMYFTGNTTILVLSVKYILLYHTKVDSTSNQTLIIISTQQDAYLQEAAEGLHHPCIRDIKSGRHPGDQLLLCPWSPTTK
jgi:hypothetical protein